MKQFERWVNKNFRGLSSATLIQTLKLESGFNSLFPETQYVKNTELNNSVYIDLYHVFIGKFSDNEYNTFVSFKELIDSLNWL